MTPRLDKNVISDALRPSMVLTSHGIAFIRRGKQVIFRICPTCGERSRADTVSANEETGAWFCHAHQCRGDILAMVAGLGGLDLRAGFAKVLESAANIAGVSGTADTSGPLRQRATAPKPPPLHDDIERIAGSHQIAAPLWGILASESDAGSSYLKKRGLDRTALGDAVRFPPNGWPSVPLFAFTGELVNVVTRRFPGSEPVSRRISPELDWPFLVRHVDAPKVRGLAGCTTKGALVGRLRDAESRDVVIAEGVIDSLTAIQAWPHYAVLGASGSGNLPEIARRVAPLLRTNGQRCLIAADGDDAGEQAAAKAIAFLRSGGVPPCRIEVVDLGSAHDLSSAWESGWRP